MLASHISQNKMQNHKMLHGPCYHSHLLPIFSQLVSTFLTQILSTPCSIFSPLSRHWNDILPSFIQARVYFKLLSSPVIFYFLTLINFFLIKMYQHLKYYIFIILLFLLLFKLHESKKFVCLITAFPLVFRLKPGIY